MHCCSSRKYPDPPHTPQQMSEQLQVLKESRADAQVQFVRHTHTHTHGSADTGGFSAASRAPLIVCRGRGAAGGLIRWAHNCKSFIKTLAAAMRDVSRTISALFHFHVEKKLGYEHRGGSEDKLLFAAVACR